MSNDPGEAFRVRLRALRSAAQLSQEKLAERAGLNYKHYQEIERGGKKEIRLSTLLKIAEALGVSTQHLFSEVAPETVLQEATAPYNKKRPAKKRAQRAR